MDELEFEDADGVVVGYRRSVPGGGTRGVVVVLHGASEHSARYDRVAGVLTDAGWAVYAVDLRGHGRTAASTGPGRIGPRGMAGVFDGVRTLIERARQEHPGVPVVLFGHSMGSVIAQGFVEEHGDTVDAYVLSGTMGVVPQASELAAGIRAAVEAGMADEPLDVLSGLNDGFEPARTPYDWLTRDPAEVDAYLADPLCGDDLPLTYGFAAAMLDTVAASMEPEQLARVPGHLPVLLLTGDADPVSAGGTQVRELEARLRAVGLAVDAHYYAGARHEVLNETNRDEVHADLLAFLDRITAR